MIEVEQLTKSFQGKTVVDGLSFGVKPGEVLGFLGPNGAGKSTSMKMICGFIAPTSGSVRILGHDIERATRKAQQRLGYLPEGAPAYEEMRVEDFLQFIAQARGLRGSHAKARVAHVLDRVNLHEVRHQRIETLSKGFKRRTGLAQAIIHDPEVLVLDEPTDGLDPNQKHQVRALINELSHDKIIIISTHILEEVSTVCTRAMLIADGKMVADETPSALQQQSRYHGALSLEFPELTKTITEQLATLEGYAGLETSVDNPQRVTVLAKPGASLYREFDQLRQQRGWSVSEASIDAGRLDDVFRRLTQDTDHTTHTTTEEAS